MANFRPNQENGFGRFYKNMNNIRTLIFTLLLWVVIVLVLAWLINTLTIQIESSIVLPLPMVQVNKRDKT